jgi:hypothetical protein
MPAYPETSRKNQDKPESHKEMQRRTGKSRLIQELPRKYRSFQNKKSCARNIQELAGSHSIKKEKTGTYRAHGYGKVEFCLPTKLRAPSLADHVIGRTGHTLNAFGLFAREAQETLEARRSDLGARDSRMGDLIHRLTCGSPRTDKLTAATNAFFPETESRQIRRSAQFRS